MKTDNYNEYDKLKLYVKKKKSNEIIKNYDAFQWKLIERAENVIYEDIEDLTFVRKHKIENKDELQLLQVYMEERLNEAGKLERNKYSKTTSFGLCFGIIGALLILLGTLCCINVFNFMPMAGGITCISMGVILIIGLVFLPKIIKREKTDYSLNIKEINEQVEEICNKAKLLVGGDKEDGQ